jgi:cytochrome b
MGAKVQDTVRVWDAPVRAFHWLLALAVTASFVTGRLGGGLMDWHGRLGVFIVGLVVFRIAWGFVGSTHARFASFLPTWRRISAYLGGRWRGLGHNPVGGLSVLTMLVTLGALAGTGLLANDDVAFQGPLSTLVAKDLSDALTGWHSRLFNGLAVLVCLHVGAMLFYAVVKKTNLVWPMITGRKPALDEVVGSPPGSPPGSASGWWRLALALAIAGAVAWGAGSDVLVKVLSPAPTQASSAEVPPSW